MNTVKNIRKSQKSALFIFAITLFRILSISGDSQLGFNFTRLDIFYSYEYTVYWIAILTFCALFSFVMFRLIDRYDEKIGILCAIVIMDPLFACLQKFPGTLLLSCLVLIFTLHVLSEKPLLPTEVTLVLFTLCAGTLSRQIVLSFAPLVFLLYVASKHNSLSVGRTICTTACTAAATVAGILLHTHLSKYSNSFSNFVSFLNQTAGFAEEKIYIFVLLLIPPIVFNVFLLNEFIKPEKTKKSKNNKTKHQQSEDIASTLVFLTIAAYIISVTSGVFYDINALTFTNLFVPMMFIILISHNNEKAAIACNKANDFIRQHSFILLILFILIYYFLLRFVFDDIVQKNIFSFYVIGG